MVGSTNAGHWIVDAPMKNNAEDTMKEIPPFEER
ncbi:hypothetical protein CY35_10G027900 [Sphagnum magellanicum]|nr:hypothetical protein CY35_10G027900 [Sphagnum magellanicum]